MRNSAFLAIAAIGALVGSSALAQGPVYSVNIVGFQKVTVAPGKTDFSSNPFVKSSASIQDVIGNQGEGGETISDADNILFWNGSSYDVAYLSAGNGPPYDGNWIDENGDILTTPIQPGTGFLFKNRVGGATNTLVLVGDVVSAATVSQTINPGLNLISYPYSTTIALNSLNLHLAQGAHGAETIGDADQMFVWNPVTASYAKYYLSSGNGAPIDDNWIDENGDTSPVVINPGDSIWYFRKPSLGALTYTETKPY